MTACAPARRKNASPYNRLSHLLQGQPHKAPYSHSRHIYDWLFYQCPRLRRCQYRSGPGGPLHCNSTNRYCPVIRLRQRRRPEIQGRMAAQHIIQQYVIWPWRRCGARMLLVESRLSPAHGPEVHRGLVVIEILGQYPGLDGAARRRRGIIFACSNRRDNPELRRATGLSLPAARHSIFGYRCYLISIMRRACSKLPARSR